MKKLALWSALVIAGFFLLNNPVAAADIAHTIAAGLAAFLDALTGGHR